MKQKQIVIYGLLLSYAIIFVLSFIKIRYSYSNGFTETIIFNSSVCLLVFGVWGFVLLIFGIYNFITKK